MAVTDQTPSNSSTGNGVTTVFPYAFKIIEQADLQVLVDGDEQTLNTDYTVSGAGDDAGGNVTFTTAPAADTTVVRRRNMSFVRSTDYQYQGDLPNDVLNDDQDAPVLMLQQLAEEVGRSLKIPAGESAVSELPSAADRAGYMLAFDETTGAPEITTFTAEQVANAVAAAYGTGSTLDALTFLQAGTGAVPYSAQTKMRHFIAAQDFGATGDGTTDDTAALQAAIDHAESLGGGDVYLGYGDFMITAQLDVNAHNVRLVGCGQGGFNTGIASIRTTAATRIFWGGAAAVTTALVEFKTPDAGIIQGGGGLDRLMLDCMNLCGTGLRLRTWAHGTFENLVVYGSTLDGIRVTTTLGTLAAEPYDSLKNVFINIHTIFGNLTGNNSNGLRLGRATSSPGTGNACYNGFYRCVFNKGGDGGGYGILLENTDNNMFYSISTPEVVFGSANDGDGSGASRSNAFFGLEADVTAKASQTGLSSSNNNYISGLTTTNTKGDITVETGAGGSSDATLYVDWADGRKRLPALAVAAGATITSQELLYRQQGAWTPGVEGGTTPGTVTVANRLGTYTLIGNRCDFDGFINYNTLTGTGDLRLTGLPFTAATGRDPTVLVRASNLTFTGQLTASVNAGTAYITFQQVATAAAMTNVQVDAAAIIHVSGSYTIN